MKLLFDLRVISNLLEDGRKLFIELTKLVIEIGIQFRGHEEQLVPKIIVFNMVILAKSVCGW